MDKVRRLNHRLAQSPFLLDPVWPLSPLAYDTFTRGDGAIGSTELAGPNAEVISAFAWVNNYGTWNVSSNIALSSALESGVLSIATIVIVPTNYVVSANLVRAGGVVGVCARVAGVNDLVRAYHTGTNIVLQKRIASVNTSVIDEVVAYSAGALLQIVVRNTKFKVFYNNVQIGSEVTISNASVQTGVPGLYTTHVGNTFDNFLVYRINSYNYF